MTNEDFVRFVMEDFQSEFVLSLHREYVQLEAICIGRKYFALGKFSSLKAFNLAMAKTASEMRLGRIDLASTNLMEYTFKLAKQEMRILKTEQIQRKKTLAKQTHS